MGRFGFVPILLQVCLALILEDSHFKVPKIDPTLVCSSMLLICPGSAGFRSLKALLKPAKL